MLLIDFFKDYFFSKPQQTSGTTFDEIVAQIKQAGSQIHKTINPVQDYCVKETMAALELSFLQSDPPLLYRGRYIWHDSFNTKYLTFIPCALRPEVLYCSYGQN